MFGGARLEVCWPRRWRREDGNRGVGRSLLGLLYLMENLVRFSWHVGKYENVSYYPRPGTVGEQHCALSGEGVLVEEVSGALGR